MITQEGMRHPHVARFWRERESVLLFELHERSVDLVVSKASVLRHRLMRRRPPRSGDGLVNELAERTVEGHTS